jgi:hypothetical protein
VPRLLAFHHDVVSRISQLLAARQRLANRSRMTALTCCARITPRRLLAFARLKALRLWRVFRNDHDSRTSPDPCRLAFPLTAHLQHVILALWSHRHST